jgi:L-ascorbate metabolism protein UlaG (beta-lactamase superfamily)
LEEIGEVDILFVPVGGEYTLGAKEAAEVVNAIGPTLTIPMHFQTPGLNPETFAKLRPVEEFLSQVGMKVESQVKLKVTQETLLPERVILLTKK